METLRFAISLILGMALPFAVQRWERARLPPERRAAAWNVASWGAALYAFGPVSMIGWAWVTRVRFGAWRREQGTIVALLRCVVVVLIGVRDLLLIALAMGLGDEALKKLLG
jgi:hypothetical protein